jgi:2-oxoisovalerate dehydrogenase E2 component (dihydrolipoyl transacylase)
MNGFEKGMQKSMTESNTIPHLYLHEELDITEV